MSGDKYRDEPTNDETTNPAVGGATTSVVQLLPYIQARTAMVVICAILALAAVVSFGCFGYQSYKLFSTGGAYFPTTVSWSSVLGHLFRAGGLGIVCWQLTRVALAVDAKTRELSDDFASRHRSFWRSAASVLALLGGYAIFEAYSNMDRDRYGFFRPEFESGFVEVTPNRIEFRRGSEVPVAGWLRMKIGDLEKEAFVSPAPEITGNDIRRAMVRIAEIFPGSQSAELRIEFTAEGAVKMEKFTRSHLAHPLAVLVDGELRGTPRVFSPISGDANSAIFSRERRPHA